MTSYEKKKCQNVIWKYQQCPFSNWKAIKRHHFYDLVNFQSKTATCISMLLSAVSTTESEGR